MRVRHLLPSQRLFSSFSNPDSNYPICYIPPFAMLPVAFRIYPLQGRSLVEIFKKASCCPAGQYMAGRFAGGI
jgi:hypothetical protein